MNTTLDVCADYQKGTASFPHINTPGIFVHLHKEDQNSLLLKCLAFCKHNHKSTGLESFSIYERKMHD